MSLFVLKSWLPIHILYYTKEIGHYSFINMKFFFRITLIVMKIIISFNSISTTTNRNIIMPTYGWDIIYYIHPLCGQYHVSISVYMKQLKIKFNFRITLVIRKIIYSFISISNDFYCHIPKYDNAYISFSFSLVYL